MDQPNEEANAGLTRRGVLRAATALAATTPVLAAQAQGTAGSSPAAAHTGRAPAAGTQSATTHLTVNGKRVEITADTRTTLLDALRENLQMGGTKKGCDHGQCGACTVLADGRRINSCLSLVAMHDGQSVTTIEGFARGEQLHPLQQAFLTHDGFQCGYCTPGQICSAAGMLAEVRAGMPSHVTANLQQATTLSEEEIRERMSGNICRCSAYPNIIAAIKDAAGRGA